jgi:hypothetical protein
VELPEAELPEHGSQLFSHDLQCARESPHRSGTGDRCEARFRCCRGAGGRVHARAPLVPLRPHGRGHLRTLQALTYPWHWHYTFLRGLDYLRLTPAISDKRLADPIELLCETRKPNGRWPLQKRIPGTLFVEMERPGQDSRWNTLRALRVLRPRRGHASTRNEKTL